MPQLGLISIRRLAYCISQLHSALSLPQHGFLVYISDRSNAEITHSTLIFTAVTQNHCDNRKARHTTKVKVKATVILNTWLSYSTNKCSRLRPLILVSNHSIDISVTSNSPMRNAYLLVLVRWWTAAVSSGVHFSSNVFVVSVLKHIHWRCLHNVCRQAIPAVNHSLTEKVLPDV